MSTTNTLDTNCPLCQGKLLPGSRDPARDGVRINCANCGDHVFSVDALTDINSICSTDEVRTRLAFGVRKRPVGQNVTTELLLGLCKAPGELPGALEQLDLLVQYLAETLAPGMHKDLPALSLMATLGTRKPEQARWVLTEALRLNLVDGVNPSISTGQWVLGKAVLTMEGWKRYDELMRSGARSEHAFMAMKFNDVQMDTIYNEHMRTAVKQTGFDLRTTVGDHATAGSIDNRMRVEIRTSRFMVCDLTHGNQGAYWEAGFAEGLGRPVFYTCRRDVLESKNHRDHPHFDTAHQNIIAWDADSPNAGMQDLKNVIRATLPADARMED